MNRVILVIALSFLCMFTFRSVGQNYVGQETQGDPNPITTATPFLLIAPDSRSSAMGDVGVATTPDVNSIHWNAAKFAFIEKDMGFSVSYTPWLSKIADDISLSYLSFYKRINDKQTLGLSLRYFSLGLLSFTDPNGNPTGTYEPNEFSFDVAYSLKLSEDLSGGVAMRYIHSNLTGGTSVGLTESHAGQAVAGDVSVYYQKEITLSGRDAILALGANVSNMGNKISYTEASPNFLPINMRIGTSIAMDIDDFNKIMFAFDVNKFLVPTPAQRRYDSIPVPGEFVIIGKDPNTAVASGMFGSFSDAPGELEWNTLTGNWESKKGSVTKEELQEIMYSVGLEYWYANQFALRTGYFHEHETKGARKYLTLGLGLKLNVFGIDFSYLIPVKSLNHPLSNTMRFSLYFDFEGFKKQNEPKPKI